MKIYEPLDISILEFSTDDAIRTSGVTGTDNEDAWDNGWDRS